MSDRERRGSRRATFGGWVGIAAGEVHRMARGRDLSADGIGLVLYPSRESFGRLTESPRFREGVRFRESGFERSWVVHCRITAASEPADVAPRERAS